MDFFEPKGLVELAKTKMPFGKYAGHLLVNLPEPYLVWFEGKGFPEGDIGLKLRAMLEIKVNGLEYLLKPIVDEKYP